MLLCRLLACLTALCCARGQLGDAWPQKQQQQQQLQQQQQQQPQQQIIEMSLEARTARGCDSQPNRKMLLISQTDMYLVCPGLWSSEGQRAQGGGRTCVLWTTTPNMLVE